jgi:hypothetical protein
MKLIEALQILKKPLADGSPFTVFLVCGFEPLHLETFLAAHLTSAFRDRRIVVRGGV